jgi:hypothetical protein
VSIPDARRVTHGVSWKERRHGPRHAAVWVHVDGAWRRGRVVEWIRELGRDGWELVIMAEDRHNGPSWQGRYAYDRASIRPRYNDRPPA